LVKADLLAAEEGVPSTSRYPTRQAGGESAALYRDTVAMKEIADRFIRAQTGANRQCFGRDGSPAK
jgi:hypothetical protein